MMQHDGVVYHFLGGASYYFADHLIRYINNQCTGSQIILHIGTQSNSSPHIGNIITFATAFTLASALKLRHSREVRLRLVYVDSAPAPGNDLTINGIQYQRSLGYTGDFQANKAAFKKVLDQLSSLSSVKYEDAKQSLWHLSTPFSTILRNIISRHQTLGPHLSPTTNKLAIRAACPYPSCGLTEKHGINNQYHEKDQITFSCPSHGMHSINLKSPNDLARLEFNTPLRNFVRVLICSQDQDASWIMCTGADYAGFYQEQLLWRLLDQPIYAPIIFYTPLILDWSGSKLSKSMYVNKGAYSYLRDAGLEYMSDVDALIGAAGGLAALFEEVKTWTAEPYRFLRNYSIEYLHLQLMDKGMQPHSKVTRAGEK